ncbi:hypothetical protein H0E87_004128 [Populus deltoides]|uniref:Uncharacterized protein n=1 Tax=Populus deltoides TaxID=3696 RepID=A0A8T2ZD54_POPDE|nr:hypothetical protein H0E87_004128 [Populus deltoides]
MNMLQAMRKQLQRLRENYFARVLFQKMSQVAIRMLMFQYPLVIYDEITLGDGGMHVRNCSVIGPLPLLLLATEIVVTPAEDGSEEDDGNDYDSADGAESDEDGMETDGRLGTQHGYTSSQTQSTSSCSGGLYIYCILSIDGLRGISLPAESVESLTSMVHATEIGKPASGRRGMNQNPNSFLSLLMNNDTQQTIPSHTLQGPASAGNGSGMHGRLGPREASSKRHAAWKCSQRACILFIGILLVLQKGHSL